MHLKNFGTRFKFAGFDIKKTLVITAEIVIC